MARLEIKYLANGKLGYCYAIDDRIMVCIPGKYYKFWMKDSVYLPFSFEGRLVVPKMGCQF